MGELDDTEEIFCSVDWILQAQERVNWRALEMTAVNLRIP
jgi:hypothetical protein